jgi:hypothetical protein
MLGAPSWSVQSNGILVATNVNIQSELALIPKCRNCAEAQMQNLNVLCLSDDSTTHHTRFEVALQFVHQRFCAIQACILQRLPACYSSVPLPILCRLDSHEGSAKHFGASLHMDLADQVG